MTGNREKMYQVYHTLLSMMLAWALSMAINGYYVLKVHPAVSAVFALILSVLIHLFDRYRSNIISYLVILGIFPILGLFFWISRINVFTWIGDLSNWIYEYDYTDELYVASHAHVILFLVTLAGAVIFYILVRKQLARVILAILLFGLMITLSIIKVDIGKLVVMTCIFYILTILVEVGGKLYNRRVNRPDKKAGILYLAPICLLLAVVSISLPSKPEPIQWKGVKAIYRNIKDTIERIIDEWEFFSGSGSGEFGISFTGYSEDSSDLSTDVLRRNSEIALKVSGNQANGSVYLTGSVSDIYTGSSWEKSKLDQIPDEEEYYLDYAELVTGMSRVDHEVLEDNSFVNRRLMKVVYDRIKTKTFFYPVKTSSIDILKGGAKPDFSYSNILFPEGKGRGTTYECIFYEMNLKGEAFQQMLRDTDAFSYGDGEYMNSETMLYLEQQVFGNDSAPSIIGKSNLYEILKSRSEVINDKYTVLPETLPERVYELALDITKDKETKYDKLKAIEEYLINNYTYSLTPGATPEDEDFVDQFLFEKKQGFCTSFATSMAVLGRCIGIPTRYVEGFILDYSAKEDIYYLIRKYKAHSWAEAYFEGVGWIPFEATPPYYEERYVTWRDRKQYYNVPDYSQYYMMEQQAPEIVAPKPVTTEKKEISGGAISGIIIFFAILVMILVFILYYLILRHRYKKAYDKADFSTKMYMLFIRILYMLKREGFTLYPYETILMLNERVKNHYQFDEVAFKDVATVFMRYRYAETEVSGKEFKQVEIFYNGLKEKQNEETGRLKRHLEEFMFLTRKGRV